MAPSLVVGHLGPFLWSGAAAHDGRDARDRGHRFRGK